jgi:hypothetical protein
MFLFPFSDLRTLRICSPSLMTALPCPFHLLYNHRHGSSSSSCSYCMEYFLRCLSAIYLDDKPLRSTPVCVLANAHATARAVVAHLLQPENAEAPLGEPTRLNVANYRAENMQIVAGGRITVICSPRTGLGCWLSGWISLSSNPIRKVQMISTNYFLFRSWTIHLPRPRIIIQAPNFQTLLPSCTKYLPHLQSTKAHALYNLRPA